MDLQNVCISSVRPLSTLPLFSTLLERIKLFILCGVLKTVQSLKWFEKKVFPFSGLSGMSVFSNGRLNKSWERNGAQMDQTKTSR